MNSENKVSKKGGVIYSAAVYGLMKICLLCLAAGYALMKICFVCPAAGYALMK
jgi:hypothetical protein